MILILRREAEVGFRMGPHERYTHSDLINFEGTLERNTCWIQSILIAG